MSDLDPAEIQSAYLRKLVIQIVMAIPLVTMIVLSDRNGAGLPLPLLGVALVAALGVSWWNWRCPACQRYLGRAAFHRSCPSCGVSFWG